jgi:hypothetical protein
MAQRKDVTLVENTSSVKALRETSTVMPQNDGKRHRQYLFERGHIGMAQADGNHPYQDFIMPRRGQIDWFNCHSLVGPGNGCLNFHHVFLGKFGEEEMRSLLDLWL